MPTQAEKDAYTEKMIKENPSLTKEQIDSWEGLGSPWSQEEFGESIGRVPNSKTGSENQA